MTLQKAFLGDITAEGDTSLSKYFISSTPSFSSAIDLNNKRCFLIGRTGAGKSAIINEIQERFAHDKNHLCVSIQPDKAYLDKVVQSREFLEISKDSQFSQIIFKLVWHYVIMIRVLQEKYGPEGPKKTWQLLIGEDFKAYRFLKKARQLTTDGLTMSDTVIGLIKTIGLSVGKLTATLDSNNKNIELTEFHRLIKETDNFFENGFWDVLRGHKLYLLFDDLDEGWDPDSDAQQQLLRALFQVVNKYNHRDRVKPIVALRANIFHGLNLPQREKYTDYIEYVRWTPNLLKQMLALRVENYYNIPAKDIHKKFFSGDVSGVALPEYIISNTLNRPRDVLMLAKSSIEEAIKEGSDLIFARHVKAARERYSKDRVRALHDEWKFLFPHIETMLKWVAEGIPNATPSEKLTPREVKETLEYVRERVDDTDSNNSPLWVLSYFPIKSNDPLLLVEALYKLGILTVLKDGLRHTEDNTPEMPKLTKQQEFQFHPMITPYLEIYSSAPDSIWT
ncbi:hypothetical protein DV096_07955 [Bradymonadaceae bacterium TMQ3]|nr:hypothetical protein DV096_07955 [Bradymonadaceae bacterium TMQ3]TXC76496.1 hypothetical protein FRC91_07120 [Bradymonadales bacterium TMQ1]